MSVKDIIDTGCIAKLPIPSWDGGTSSRNAPPVKGSSCGGGIAALPDCSRNGGKLLRRVAGSVPTGVEACPVERCSAKPPVLSGAGAGKLAVGGGVWGLGSAEMK